MSDQELVEVCAKRTQLKGVLSILVVALSD